MRTFAIILMIFVSFCLGRASAEYDSIDLWKYIQKTIVKKVVKVDIDFEKLQKHYKWMTKKRYNLIVKYGKKYNVDIYLISAIMETESSGNRFAKGKTIFVLVWKKNKYKRVKTNALGLLQILPVYHYKYKNKKDLYNEQTNIRIGVKYFAFCMKKKKGILWKAIGSYAGGHNLNPKYYSKNYIAKVFVLYNKSKKS